MRYLLQQLRGRSLGELIERGRRKSVSVVERMGAGSDLVLPSDERFVGLFKGVKGLADVVSCFREWDGPLAISRGFSRAEVEYFRSRFPRECGLIISEADRIRRGRFSLLGYEDLDFGYPHPDWHLDPVSGRRSPRRHRSRISETNANETGDKKTVWELNRHQYFATLGRAYALTGDEDYAEAFISHVRSWIAENPPKIGVNWISSLEVAYRSIAWIRALGFFRRSARVSDLDVVQIGKSLYLNARHIESNLSTYSSPNTHLTGEAFALYVIGTYLRGLRYSDRWKRKGLKILLDALGFQIREDGGYVEQAVFYQRYTADIYLNLIALLREEGAEIDEFLGGKLVAALLFLMHNLPPNKRMPLMGDDDGGRLHFLDSSEYDDISSTLALGAVLFESPELKFVAGEAPAELFWLGGNELVRRFDALPITEPQENVQAFPESGCYVVREGWTPCSNFALIDCGPHGFMRGAHAHADALGFILHVTGVPVFVDSGTYNYTLDSDAREYFRSTAAHNCLTVDGASSSRPGGAFWWATQATCKVLEWDPAEGNEVLRASQDGFQDVGVGYERVFRFEDVGKLTLIEDISSGSGHRFDINFVLSPHVEALIEAEQKVTIVEKDGMRPLLAIDTTLTCGESVAVNGWSIEEAFISPRYGSRQRTSRLVFSLFGSGTIRVVSTMTFLADDK